MIPKTTTYKKFKEKRDKESANGAGVSNGQRTLDRRRVVENGTEEDRREDAMLDLNGHDDDAHLLSPKPPMATHSSYSHSTLVVGDSRPQRSADEDIDMIE